MDVRTVEELSLLESIEDFRRAYTVTPLDKERREMLRCLTHRIVEHDRMQRHNSEVIAKAKRVASIQQPVQAVRRGHVFVRHREESV